MSDLISREAVIKAMENNSFMVEAFGTKRKMIDGMMMCVEIAELPTVEAKEAVHAKWIDGCCSNCGAYVPTDSRIDFIDEEDCKFCYECGASMRTSAE